MIDFHAHLDLYPEPRKIIQECSQRNMYVLSVTNTPSAWEMTNRLAEDAIRIKTALGLHPQLAKNRQHELPLFDQLLPHTRYVGEVGLDGAPEYRSSWKIQQAVFEHILNSCAGAGGRIMTIHSRRAASEVLDLLERYPKSGIPILHWFSGSKKELLRAIDLGCWFSVNPLMLASPSGAKLFQLIPRDRVLTESDGPFTRFEERSLEPWDVDAAYVLIGNAWATARDATDHTLSKNLRELVGMQANA